MSDRTPYNLELSPSRSEQSRREIALAMAAVWRERYEVADTMEQGMLALTAAERWEREAFLLLSVPVVSAPPAARSQATTKGEDNAK